MPKWVLADRGEVLCKMPIRFLGTGSASGWNTSFPSHQPMAQVIPIVKRLQNLKRFYFTHNGHTHVPHAELDRWVKREGDRRFAIAYHGLRIRA